MVVRHKSITMKTYSTDELEKLEGGSAAGSCAASIAVSATVGSLFGGIGTLVGAAVAATGPNCAGLW
jgi:hypothetical protein